MKKGFAALLIAAGVFLLFASCASEKTRGDIRASERSPILEPAKAQSPAPIDAGSGEETTARPMRARSEFSVAVGDTILTLRQRGTEYLSGLPLEKISEEKNQTDLKTRIYRDSYIRKLEFDGLEIELYASGDDEEPWITRMTVLKKGIFTSRGIQVGDSLERLLEEYQEDDISPYGGDGEGNIYRFISVDPYQEIGFAVAAGKVTKITLNASLE